MASLPQSSVYADALRLPLSSINLQKAICMLEGEKDQNPADYYYFMGQLLMKYNYLEEAKCYFSDALEVMENPNPVYFQFYKIDIREGNYAEAFLDLFRYQQNCDCPCDFSFSLTMLEMYNDLKYFKKAFTSTDYKVSPSALLGTITIANTEIEKHYLQAVEAFNQLDLPKLKESLENSRYLEREKYLRFEIKTLIHLANALEKKYAIQAQKPTSTYFKENTIKENLLLIESMISSNIGLAKELLKEIEQKKKYQDYSRVISYLHGRIWEEELYQTLDLDKKNIYEECIQQGRIACRIRDFDQAYEWYLTGRKETGHPIFDYYIAKVLYKKGSLTESIELLNNYRQQAGAKFIQSTVFLYYGYYRTRQWEKQREEMQNMDQFSIVFESAFTREKKSFRRLDHKKNPDSREQEAYSSIVMTEEDFSDDRFSAVGRNKVLYKNKSKYGK